MLPRLWVVTTATILLLKIGFFATLRERMQENYTYLSMSLVWCCIFNILLLHVGVWHIHPSSPCSVRRGHFPTRTAPATRWPPGPQRCWSWQHCCRGIGRGLFWQGYRNAVHALVGMELAPGTLHLMLTTKQGSAGWDRDVPKLNFDKWKDLLWISEA